MSDKRPGFRIDLEKFKPTKADLQKAKEVLKIKRYFLVFALVSVISFVVFYALMMATNSYSIALFIEMNGALFAYFNLALLGISALLFGLFASMSLYKFELIREVGEKNMTLTSGGVLTALFSAGCPSCGSLLLPLIGISSLAAFPFGGLELKVASIALLGLVNVRTVKSLESCATCEPKVRLSTPIISSKMDKVMYGAIFVIGALILFNQAQVAEISSTIAFQTAYFSGAASLNGGGEIDLSGIDISQINSTAMAIATLFPVNRITSEEDAIALMIPAGTPEYSDAIGGISFDDPVNSMEYLAQWYYSLKPEVQQNDPQVWQRYLSLAAAPRGISCEFCCGVGPQGITADGELKCGCKHNPAVQALTIGLMQHTDYSDAEVLREVMRWKTIFFPKNMVGLAMDVSGIDPSQLKDLPGMVGGC